LDTHAASGQVTFSATTAAGVTNSGIVPLFTASFTVLSGAPTGSLPGALALVSADIVSASANVTSAVVVDTFGVQVRVLVAATLGGGVGGREMVF
jgi:hypothetical protein